MCELHLLALQECGTGESVEHASPRFLSLHSLYFMVFCFNTRSQCYTFYKSAIKLKNVFDDYLFPVAFINVVKVFCVHILILNVNSFFSLEVLSLCVKPSQRASVSYNNFNF